MKIFCANVARTNAFTDSLLEWNLATNAGISRFGFLRRVQRFLTILEPLGALLERDARTHGGQAGPACPGPTRSRILIPWAGCRAHPLQQSLKHLPTHRYPIILLTLGTSKHVTNKILGTPCNPYGFTHFGDQEMHYNTEPRIGNP